MSVIFVYKVGIHCAILPQATACGSLASHHPLDYLKILGSKFVQGLFSLPRIKYHLSQDGPFIPSRAESGPFINKTDLPSLMEATLEDLA